MNNTYNLPFGIVCETIGNAGSIKSDLKKHLGSKKQAYALESFLLALACEGVFICDTRIVRALESIVEQIVNNS